MLDTFLNPWIYCWIHFSRIYFSPFTLTTLAQLIATVQVRTSDELNQGVSRESRGLSVQKGIDPTDCGVIHVTAGVFCLSLA